MHFKITLLLALWAVAAMAAPVEDMKPMADVPDQDAESQFLYSYGYPGAYAYAASALPAAYHVPVSTVAANSGVIPAATTKLITQPAPLAYTYPGYAYPYASGFGYAYGYPYAI